MYYSLTIKYAREKKIIRENTFTVQDIFIGKISTYKRTHGIRINCIQACKNNLAFM